MLQWIDPVTTQEHRYLLAEGAMLTLGRSPENDITIEHPQVSRLHATITYRDGRFWIIDLDSRNGTFVDDRRIVRAHPLQLGNRISLYEWPLEFLSPNVEAVQNDISQPKVVRERADGEHFLMVANGRQEGLMIPLLLQQVQIGRASLDATWEVSLQDDSVSRPHAEISYGNGAWHIRDLASRNGTFVNGRMVLARQSAVIRDGDTLQIGSCTLLFGSSYRPNVASTRFIG